MKRPTNLVSVLVVAGCAFAVSASGGPTPASGPHDRAGEFDVETYWYPRHRAILAERGLTPQPATRRAASRLRFSRAVRVSDDLIQAPGSDLPLAQAESQTEPYLAVNPEDPNHLVAGWQENRFLDGGARALGYAVSRDGGRTWQEGRIPGLTTVDGGPWDKASDPWPAFGPDGRVFFASLLIDASSPANAIAVSVSDDGGSTWKDPVTVVRDAVNFNDKEAVVADPFTSSPYRGNAYVGWDENLIRNGQAAGQKLVISRSTDGGRSWRKPVVLRQGLVNIGVIPVVAPDGTVYAIWSGGDAADPNLLIFFARSTDGGRTFSRARPIAELLATGVPGYRTGGILPAFAIDPASGDLYAAWADSRFTGNNQATLSFSRDGGATWSEPARISDGPDALPVVVVSVAVNATGQVAVGYYQTAATGSGAPRTDHYVNLSDDGGVSFGTRDRSTRKSFDPTTAAYAGSAIFLGDYIGFAGAGDRFLALWTATYKRSRLGPGRQSDIFIARSR